MGAVGEAVQRAVREDWIVEEDDPFVHRTVAGDDRGGRPMALDEHIVTIARRLGGELGQADVVEEEQVRREPGPQLPLEGVIGSGLIEGLQELGDGDAADAMAGAAGAVTEGADEECLPDIDWAAEDDVLLLGQPVQAEERADAGAIEADRAVPHDLLDGGRFVETGLVRRRVSRWLSRHSISSWSRRSRTSTWLSFPCRA